MRKNKDYTPPNRLRELRESRDLSQDQLGELLNTTRGQIYKLENGLRKMTQPWMIRLGNVLNYPPEEFIKSSVAPTIQMTRLESARRQLDCGIELWFNDGEIVAIRTLSSAAYNEFFSIGAERSIKLPELISSQNVEGVLFFAVAALQAIGERLNLIEQAFYSWLSGQDPKLFAESSRIFLRSIAPADNNIGRSEFFRRFIGRRD